jgi:hypothetical protein
MLQLEPLLLEDPDKHDQLDRAISSGAAVFVGSAISEFTDTLAAALQEAQRLMGEGVNGGTNL